MSLTIMIASSTRRMLVTMLRANEGAIRRGFGRADDGMVR
jgi:hypothetical protein